VFFFPFFFAVVARQAILGVSGHKEADAALAGKGMKRRAAAMLRG
jgi:hypothetical protein